MDNEDQVMQFFGRAYNKVLQLYNEDDKEEECIAAAQNLLEDPDLPRYHRIKTLVLLGSSLNEWDETETCRLEAERLWEQARRHCAQLDNPDAPRALAKLSVDLDAVGKMQRDRLDEMFGNSEDEYEVDYDEEGDEEENEKEEEREADAESDGDVDFHVDAGVDAGVHAASAAVSDAVSDAESKKGPDSTANIPHVVSRGHAMDEGELSFGNEAEDATDMKSGEGTEDTGASAMTLGRNKLTGSLRFKAGKKGGLAHRPSLAALRSRVVSGQQQHEAPKSDD
ncbi:hypothetical protein V502_04924 [Pseudogymnoascus sp. VKM F-4520 (FW-2644)]|nr:hypothetical protein V502_04924 [Pseudogymnoascus sp. VKM F-4520 (FW-2644)]